ncbi:hypothetical protein [Planosporangium thailandense]|nr:hypothetical protein [Planosporangium thailandense]
MIDTLGDLPRQQVNAASKTYVVGEKMIDLALKGVLRELGGSEFGPAH